MPPSRRPPATQSTPTCFSASAGTDLVVASGQRGNVNSLAGRRGQVESGGGWGHAGPPPTQLISIRCCQFSNPFQSHQFRLHIHQLLRPVCVAF